MNYSWALLRLGTYVCTLVHLNGDDAFTGGHTVVHLKSDAFAYCATF